MKQLRAKVQLAATGIDHTIATDRQLTRQDRQIVSQRRITHAQIDVGQGQGTVGTQLDTAGERSGHVGQGGVAIPVAHQAGAPVDGHVVEPGEAPRRQFHLDLIARLGVHDGADRRLGDIDGQSAGKGSGRQGLVGASGQAQTRRLDPGQRGCGRTNDQTGIGQRHGVARRRQQAVGAGAAGDTGGAGHDDDTVIATATDQGIAAAGTGVQHHAGPAQGGALPFVATDAHAECIGQDLRGGVGADGEARASRGGVGDHKAPAGTIEARGQTFDVVQQHQQVAEGAGVGHIEHPRLAILQGEAQVRAGVLEFATGDVTRQIGLVLRLAGEVFCTGNRIAQRREEGLDLGVGGAASGHQRSDPGLFADPVPATGIEGVGAGVADQRQRLDIAIARSGPAVDAEAVPTHIDGVLAIGQDDLQTILADAAADLVLPRPGTNDVIPGYRHKLGRGLATDHQVVAAAPLEIDTAAKAAGVEHGVAKLGTQHAVLDAGQAVTPRFPSAHLGRGHRGAGPGSSQRQTTADQRLGEGTIVGHGHEVADKADAPAYLLLTSGFEQLAGHLQVAFAHRRQRLERLLYRQGVGVPGQRVCLLAGEVKDHRLAGAARPHQLALLGDVTAHQGGAAAAAEQTQAVGSTAQHRVAAAATIEAVAAAIAEQHVVADTPDQGVVAAAAQEYRVAGAGLEGVVTGDAFQLNRTAERRGVQHIGRSTAHQGGEFDVAQYPVGPAGHAQRGIGQGHVGVGAGLDAVVAATGLDTAAPGAEHESVVLRAADKLAIGGAIQALEGHAGKRVAAGVQRLAGPRGGQHQFHGLALEAQAAVSGGDRGGGASAGQGDVPGCALHHVGQLDLLGGELTAQLTLLEAIAAADRHQGTATGAGFQGIVAAAPDDQVVAITPVEDSVDLRGDITDQAVIAAGPNDVIEAVDTDEAGGLAGPQIDLYRGGEVAEVEDLAGPSVESVDAVERDIAQPHTALVVKRPTRPVLAAREPVLGGIVRG